MEAAEILRQLKEPSAKLARAALAEAGAHREEITPGLLAILEDTIGRAAELADDEHRSAHLYAMLLLAQFRETRAYPLVLRFASLPGDVLDDLCGDFITMDLGQVLASVCGGELEGIQSLIENEHAYEWARTAALSALVTLVAAGQKDREEILNYFQLLFRGKLKRKYSSVWDSLVSYVADLYPEDLMADIKRAYREGLVDPRYTGLEEIKQDLAMGKDYVLARLAQDPNLRLVEDAAVEIGWWPCFQEDEAGCSQDAAMTLEGAYSKPAEVTQAKSTKPKAGRNEPCPCGSGKKFKKCCGA